MPIYTGGPIRRQGRTLAEAPTTLADTLKAAASGAWATNPVTSYSRWTELDDAQHGELERVFSPRDGFVPRRDAPSSPLLSADDARRRIADEQLDLTVPDAGIREDALDILMTRQRQRRERQNIESRGPTGFVPGMLKLGTGLAVSLVDPVNVASAFIPVVGPTRYAAMLAKAGGAGGRAAVRARVGALEGAVGATAVEPIVYFTQQAEQSDYGLADSVANVVFGSVLGGGLHAGAGAVADALAKGTPWWAAPPAGPTAERVATWTSKERQEILDLAVKQAVSGRKVDVAAVVDYRDALAEFRPSTLADAEVGALKSLTDEFRAELTPRAKTDVTAADVKALKIERRQVDEALIEVDRQLAARTELPAAAKTQDKADAELPRQRRRLERRKQQIMETLEGRDAANRAKLDLARLESGLVPTRYKARVAEQAKQLYEKHGKNQPVPGDLLARLDAERPKRLNDTWERVRQQAADADPNKVHLVDTAAADTVSGKVKEHNKPMDEATAREDLAADIAEVRDLEKSLDRSILDTLTDYDEKIAQAATLADALKFAALCRLRRG